nr:HigA family addiction module antitoxin [Paraburkholderia graminis]
MSDMRNPPHPGEMIKRDVLVPLGISITEAAQRLGITYAMLSRLINGHFGISVELAMRLEKAGVSTARFWLALQAVYDISAAQHRERPVVIALQNPVSFDE